VEKALPVDGFRLAYERSGDGPAMVLLHGWPGDHTDYRDVVPIVSSLVDVVVPDLRGFGESDKHRSDPAGSYSADAQARNVVGLIEQLGMDRPVIGGLRHWQPYRSDPGTQPARPHSRAGCLTAAARHRQPNPHRPGTTGVLVPGISPARPGRATH
jgi:alpha/beta hydrolase fold